MKLHDEIRCFLKKHAEILPEIDPEDELEESEKYTSPDAAMLHVAADLIETGKKPKRVWSDWGSGGYHPYTDKKAKDWHDQILQKIQQF